MDIIEIDIDEPGPSAASAVTTTDDKPKRKRRNKEEIEQEKVLNIFCFYLFIHFFVDGKRSKTYQKGNDISKKCKM